jgi:alpha-beta hydrolase superfamily lysophospholipase
MLMDIAIKFEKFPSGLVHFYQHWIPKDPPACVVFVPGLGDHIGRYSRLVDSLSGAGLAVALYDQRGHGLSEGRRGHVARFADWVDDLYNFVQFTYTRIPQDTPLAIAGQGLGALIGINFVLAHALPVCGVVAVSPWLKPFARTPDWRRRAHARMSRFVPWMTVGDGIRPADLTRDVSEVELISADPLFHGRMSLRAAQEIERNVGLIGGMPHRLHEPLLMLAGTADRVCDPQAASWFTARSSSADKDCRIYDGMYHDLLHDAGWQTVVADMTRWICERAGLAEGANDQLELGSRGEVWQNVSS